MMMNKDVIIMDHTGYYNGCFANKYSNVMQETFVINRNKDELCEIVKGICDSVKNGGKSEYKDVICRTKKEFLIGSVDGHGSMRVADAILSEGAANG
jgi:hypothetical protein